MKKEYVIFFVALAALLIMSTTKAKSYTLLARENWNLFGPMIDEIAARYGVPRERIAAMILVESANDHLAVGRAGERGLMQIMQPALSDVNAHFALNYSWQDMFSIPKNIEAGAAYLTLCYRWTGRVSWDKATQAYNAGPGAVNSNPNAGTDYLMKVLQRETEVRSFLASI